MAAAGVAVPLLFRPREARALSRAAVRYVETAPGARTCAACISFVPGPKADAPGTCYVVDGPVSPKGYCDEWAPRSG